MSSKTEAQEQGGHLSSNLDKFSNSFLDKFSPNLLNGRIDKDRARSKQSLKHRPWPLHFDRDIPGNRQNLEAKV